MGRIVDPNQEGIAKILDKPQNMAILKFLLDKDWMGSRELSDELGMSNTLLKLYLSDLEKGGILQRRTEDDKEMYKLVEMDEEVLKNLMKGGEMDISTEKIEEAVGLYFDIYLSLLKRLGDVGGKSSVENVIIKGLEKVDDPETHEILLELERDKDKTLALRKVKQMLTEGEGGSGDFQKTKEDFICVLKHLIESLEKFMGKLYGRHLTRSSLKPVIDEKLELVQELNLLAGLPREYFPVGGE